MSTAAKSTRHPITLKAWIGDDGKVHLTGQAGPGRAGELHIHVSQPSQDRKLRRWMGEAK